MAATPPPAAGPADPPLAGSGEPAPAAGGGAPTLPDRAAPEPREPVLPDRSDDDRDVGWGDEIRDGRTDRDARWYQEQRPPHWE